MDADGYIQTWNKGAQKNKGWTASEIIGKHFSNFYTVQDKQERKPEIELEIAKKTGRVEDEDWRVRKDGTRFWANVVITALYDDDGDLQGFAKVTRNLTERKEQEDHLRKANVLLQDQQKELRRLNESKDEFISLASHQLRTPATAIKQLLGLLLEGYEGPLPDNITKIISRTYESNERQIAIVNSLLRVAQIDAGKIVLRKTNVELNAVLRGLIKQYSGVFADSQQTITAELQPEPFVGYVDEQYFRMAIENILDNASKYTQSGGTIVVKSEYAGGFSKITISDNGIGITPEGMSSLFEKFGRVLNDHSIAVAGSGLGLYWVQKVIDLHDGRIEVESRPGQGSSFHIFVPRGEIDA